MKRKSFLSIALKIVALFLLVFGVYTMVAQNREITANREEAAALTGAVTAAENENARIKEDMEALATDEGVEAIARKELGLVGAGEIVFEDVGN